MENTEYFEGEIPSLNTIYRFEAQDNPSFFFKDFLFGENFTIHNLGLLISSISFFFPLYFDHF